MSASCCGQDNQFDGVSAAFKRALWIVIAINGAMFIVEMAAGAFAGSKALQADALDFLGDPTAFKKQQQLKAMLITADAIIRLAERHGEKARELAAALTVGDNEVRMAAADSLARIGERLTPLPSDAADAVVAAVAVQQVYTRQSPVRLSTKPKAFSLKTTILFRQGTSIQRKARNCSRFWRQMFGQNQNICD